MSGGVRFSEEWLREHQARQARPPEPTRHTVAPRPTPVVKPAAAPCASDLLGAVRFSLPWPPTLNTAWRYVDGRAVVSKTARDWKRRADAAVLAQFQGPAPSLGRARVHVQLVLCPPDVRARDIDNHAKLVLDTLQRVGIVDNDSQVDVLMLNRGERVPGGRCDVTVIEIHPEA